MSTTTLRTLRHALLGLCLGLCACSDSPAKPQDGGGTDDGTTPPAGTGTIKGAIKNAAGKPVGDALVRAGVLSVKADFKGLYELTGVPAGATTVTVSAVWYAEQQLPATVKAGETTTLDATLQAAPLRLDPADKQLAEQHAAKADWTKDKLSVAVIEGPTPSRVGRALYLRNPALYRDTSAEAKVTPAPLPTIDAGGAGFDFLAGDKQALDATTIVDSLEATPIPAASRGEFAIWEPLYRHLSSVAKLGNLAQVDAAVRQQQWGGKAITPQRLERVWLHDGAIWVCIVFEPFVELGAGVTDTDGDGRKEIFAKLDPVHYSKEIHGELAEGYFKPQLDTLGVKATLDDIVNNLYDATNPEVTKTIGEAFEAPGLGTFKAPFAVLRHASGVENVLLVGP